MYHLPLRLHVGLALLSLVLPLLGLANDARAQGVIVPEQLTPIMPLADIRVGMKGYGKTVFHGTRIEPFSVEVISVIPNSSPKRSVIWVRSEDPRMVESGPVQGMSGSPIYLWDEDEPQEPGQGGRLIGAFAFGFSQSVQCLVGVQPIEYMREAATRIADADEQAQARSNRGASIAGLSQMLDRLERLPQARAASESSLWRLDEIQALLAGFAGKSAAALPTDNQRATIPGPRTGGTGGLVLPLMLPMSVGSAESARVFAPLLEPMGLLAIATDASPIAGAPPAGVDAATTSLEPGSVLSIPLAYGDLDLSAAGTVTDVLPGGEVLAFGHPMFGLGDAAVPIATGYVHFVVPRRSISFKNGGTLVPVGTLVRDEGAGVVGISEKRYTTAPISVTVNMLGQGPRQYDYQVVNEPTQAAMLTAIAVYNSIQAVHGMPRENTARVKASMRFTGGRELNLETVIAGGSPVSLVYELLPMLSVMLQNPYEPLDLESVDVAVEVEQGNRMASIIGARLDRAEVAPGDVVAVTLQLQHYAGPIEDRRIELTLPDDLEVGDYPLIISGANSFAQLKLSSQPHLMTTRNIDDLARFLQLMLSFPVDKVYAAIQLPEGGLAVGRTEMPALPSSRAAILLSPTRTDTTAFPALIEQSYNADTVVDGSISFILNVRKP
jgi:hypothetical protein